VVDDWWIITPFA